MDMVGWLIGWLFDCDTSVYWLLVRWAQAEQLQQSALLRRNLHPRGVQPSHRVH